MGKLEFMTSYMDAPREVPQKGLLEPAESLHKVRDIFRDNPNTVQVTILRSDGTFLNAWRSFGE